MTEEKEQAKTPQQISKELFYKVAEVNDLLIEASQANLKIEADILDSHMIGQSMRPQSMRLRLVVKCYMEV